MTYNISVAKMYLFLLLGLVAVSCLGARGSLIDQNENCGFWASVGECDKNPNYMLKSCAESCNGKHICVMFPFSMFLSVRTSVQIAIKNPATASTGSFYDIMETDVYGNHISFERFRDKVVLVVNVASYCGYTAENYELFRSLKKYIGWGMYCVLQRIIVFACRLAYVKLYVKHTGYAVVQCRFGDCFIPM